MFIKDNNIQLRAAEPSDARQIYVWENDMTVWRVSEHYQPYSMFQIEQFLLSNDDVVAQKQLRLMIDTPDGKSVGCIDIYDFDAVNQRCSVGILIDAQYREKHFAENAIKLLADYLFNTLLLKQLYCVIDETNKASISLFTKLGFEQCGYRKDWIKTNGGFIGLYEYQLINK